MTPKTENPITQRGTEQGLGEEPRSLKRKRRPDSFHEEEGLRRSPKRRRFSMFHERDPDRELLQAVHSFITTLEQKRDEAFEQKDTGTPHQLNLLVRFTTLWRDAYLARPGLDWTGFPTIRAPRPL
ncbi:hypothetical protein EMCG_03141 [[Emmonsia] crescens]|uniref:Uncharacterized protein n=1 Tax=[Emmonsia] crescens TaxID=73230 RepID=A0A0G2J0L4_9EURO|nr:hypothetical protein EMCG_03141 [Emmonsia crescens UAMH 3008]